MINRLICLGIVLVSTSSFAATNMVFTGIYRNDRSRHRATLETDTGRYLLDFRGTDLYHTGERFDRERVVVEGDLDVYAPTGGDYPLLRVNRITFRPYHARSFTYDIGPTRYYTEPREYDVRYDEPVIRERRVIRRYYE